MSWTVDDVGDQRGRIALITGANTGLGFETAKVLAAHGARVVLACRDEAKMADAARRLPGTVETLRLDLASLASIHEAVAAFPHPRLDLLVNNAGLMIPPHGLTKDGFELQFGTNHLGHFALTGLLLDRLLRTPDSRVVTVSSNAHRRGDIHFDDLTFARAYHPMTAYAQSKLANLLFTYELQRRLQAAAASVDLVGDGVDFRLGEVADGVAAVGSAVGEGEEPGDAVEGESEVLGVFDEPHHADRVVGVFAVSGRESGGWGEQAVAFVEPQCFDADPLAAATMPIRISPVCPPGGLTL